VILLDEPGFRASLGTGASLWLHNFKFFIGGIGSGAVVCSLLYGHWKTAWMARSMA